MSKVSAVARPLRLVLGAMLLIAFVILTGCGGGGDSTATPPPPGGNDPPSPPPTIVGVATPTSVAVVTATNAQ